MTDTPEKPFRREPIDEPVNTPISEPPQSRSALWLLLALIALLLAGWYLYSQYGGESAPPVEPPVDATEPVAEAPTPADSPGPADRAAPATRTTPRTTTQPAIPAPTLPIPIAGQNRQPDYPPDVLRRGIGGTVLLRVEVDADGRPGEIGFARRSDSRELDRAALSAVRDWQFTPATREGKPVAAVVELPVEFKPEQ
jgi:protein TonB